MMAQRALGVEALARRALSFVGRRVKVALAFAVAPLLWFLLMGLGGAAAVVAGVYMLEGAGWALIAAGMFLLCGAALIGRAMTHE